ncbi:MAG: LysM domain-containing protein, partial [Chloroflexota bacterium]
MTDTPPPTRQSIVEPPQQAIPLPDPTPIRPIVREDDTLLEIAMNYGIALEDLLLVNPAVDPRSLQIGEELTIPAADVDTTAENPVEVLLPVSPATCYPTTTDSVLCMGYVSNDTPDPVEQVRVSVAIFGHNDSQIRTTTSVIQQSYIEPGGIAPYRALFDGVQDAQVKSVTVQLVSAAAARDVFS